MTDWKIFTGTGHPHDGIDRLPPAPSWRKFDRGSESSDFVGTPQKLSPRDEQRGKTFQVSPADVDLVNVVNAALYLRRPLLITGKPGTGKTSLAYAIAHELNLGAVLMWSITARSTLQDGLYRYDAISRLQEVQRLENVNKNRESSPETQLDIGQYIQLGPVGTALLPACRPRVLLIDEFDKSDINLPNDLLNLFEEGEFEIPELARMAKQQPTVRVRTADGAEAMIQAGKVQCAEFPMIVLTSNGERDFPPAFLRRCLRLTMKPPQEKELLAMVEAHLGAEVLAQAAPLIEEFLKKRSKGEMKGDLSPDQLLNAVYLVTNQFNPATQAGETKLADLLFKYLSSVEDG